MLLQKGVPGFKFGLFLKFLPKILWQIDYRLPFFHQIIYVVKFALALGFRA
jgi:hypothetical protein